MPKPKNKKQKTHYQASINGPQLSQEEIWDDSALVRSWNDAVAEYEYYHSIHARGEDVDEVLRQAERDEEAARAELRVDATPPHGDGAAQRGPTGHEADRKLNGEVRGDGDDDPSSADEGEIDDDSNDIDVAPRQALGVQDVMAHDAAAMQDAVHAGLPVPGEAAMIGPPLPPSADPPAQTTNADATDLQPASASASAAASTSIPAPGTATEIPADQTLENIKMAYYWAGYYSGLHDGQRQAQTPSQAQSQGG